MRVIDKILATRGRGRPPIPVFTAAAPSIAERIEVAETNLAELQAQRGRLALDAVSGAEGAEARLDANETATATVEKQLGVLRSAHAEAVANDERGYAAERARNRVYQLRRVEKLAKERQEDALAISVALENACAAFRRLIVHSRSMMASSAIFGGTQPGNALWHDGSLERLVAAEIFRLGASRPDDHDQVPTFPTTHGRFGEHLTVSLPERLRRQDEISLAVLRGDVAVTPDVRDKPVMRRDPQPEPAAEAEAEHAAPKPALPDGPEAEAEREIIRASLHKPAPAAEPMVEQPVDRAEASQEPLERTEAFPATPLADNPDEPTPASADEPETIVEPPKDPVVTAASNGLRALRRTQAS